MIKELLFYCFLQIFTSYLDTGIAVPIEGEATPVPKGEFRFIVSLSYPSNTIDKNNHFCCGTLISKKHILTAKHCISGKVKNQVVVIAGSVDLRFGLMYRIKSWITYDDWAISRNSIPQYTDNDIAIVTLSQSIENIQPANISTLHDSEVLGKDVVVAGWGVIDERNDILPDSLLKTNLKVLNSDETKKYHLKLYGNSIKPEPYMYYTSANPPAILGCGDSGGPLLLANSDKVVAINEASCAVENLQNNAYTMSRHLKLLDEYMEFIEDIKAQ